MMQVIVVDDHILFRQGIASLLGAQPDFTVIGEAGSVKEAITQSLTLKPDLVLMDFILPDGTGLEATQAILTELPSTKIVFLTVHEQDEHLFQAIRLGAKGYLPKNTSINQLISYLRGLAKDEVALPPASVTRILKEFAKTPVLEEPDPEIMAQLTPRHLEVLHYLKDGATNEEIADILIISKQTVKNHISRILKTLNVHSRHEAARFARRYNL